MMETGQARELRADPVLLEQEALRAGSQAEELQTLLFEMTCSVERMCEDWDGIAGETFLEEYRALTEEAGRIAVMVSELSSRAGAYARELQEEEAAWSGRFRG